MYNVIKVCMQKLAEGYCRFEVIQDISQKTNKPYKFIQVSFNDYTLKSRLFVNDDQLFIIKQKAAEKKAS